MSANHRMHEEYLEYYPEKERKALKQAIYVEKEIENVAESAVRQLNRSKPLKTEAPKKA